MYEFDPKQTYRLVDVRDLAGNTKVQERALYRERVGCIAQNIERKEYCVDGEMVNVLEMKFVQDRDGRWICRYLRTSPVSEILEKENVKGISHITGGGFYENIPRMLPEGVRAVVKKDSYEVPAIFKLMAKKADIAEEMMYNTFNMGLGMIVAVDPVDVDKAMEAIKAAGDTPYVVGHIEAGEKGVTLC